MKFYSAVTGVSLGGWLSGKACSGNSDRIAACVPNPGVVSVAQNYVGKFGTVPCNILPSRMLAYFLLPSATTQVPFSHHCCSTVQQILQPQVCLQIPSLLQVGEACSGMSSLYDCLSAAAVGFLLSTHQSQPNKSQIDCSPVSCCVKCLSHHPAHLTHEPEACRPEAFWHVSKPCLTHLVCD